jgi:hypothetical protein
MIMFPWKNHDLESRGHSYAATRQPLPSRYAPSADSYATPVNFEEPVNDNDSSPRGLADPACQCGRPRRGSVRNVSDVSDPNDTWTSIRIDLAPDDLRTQRARASGGSSLGMHRSSGATGLTTVQGSRFGKDGVFDATEVKSIARATGKGPQLCPTGGQVVGIG